MKTTLELPDELYREVKSQAALRGVKMKDLLAEGLRLALAQAADKSKSADGPLAVFDEVRARPLHRPKDIEKIIESSHKCRKGTWRDEQ